MRQQAGQADRRALIPRLRGIHGVLMDADGVVTMAATVHAAAWKRAMDAFLKEFHAPAPALVRPFDPAADYWRYFAGRTGQDGAADFLALRGIELPTGCAADRPGWSSVRALAAAQDRVFADYARRYRVLPRAGTLRVVRELRRGGIGVAAVSPGRSTRELLGRAGVAELFDVVSDACGLGTEDFRGPPDPMLLLAAAGKLNTARAHTAAVLGSEAAVVAARQAGLGLVVAVDHRRSMQSELELARAGAHLVVRDVRELLVSTAADLLAAPVGDHAAPRGERDLDAVAGVRTAGGRRGRGA